MERRKFDQAIFKRYTLDNPNIDDTVSLEKFQLKNGFIIVKRSQGQL